MILGIIFDSLLPGFITYIQSRNDQKIRQSSKYSTKSNQKLELTAKYKSGSRIVIKSGACSFFRIIASMWDLQVELLKSW